MLDWPSGVRPGGIIGHRTRGRPGACCGHDFQGPLQLLSVRQVMAGQLAEADLNRFWPLLCMDSHMLPGIRQRLKQKQIEVTQHPEGFH